MQPTSSKIVLFVIAQIILFAAAGLFVGSITIGIVKFFMPGLGANWDWLSPLIGGIAGIGLFILVEYVRKHPDGVR